MQPLTQDQLNAIGKQVGYDGQFSSVGLPTAPISAVSLGNPQAPFNLNAPQNTSQADSLLGTTEALATQTADAYTQGLNKDKETAGAATGKSLQDVLSSMLNSQGETELTGNAYATEGVNTAKDELNTINNEILQSQVGLKRQLEAIEKNPYGKSASALTDEMNDAKTAAASYEADLSVVAMAKQNKFSSAKEMADRSVAVQYERQQQRNEALKFMYEENKEQFSKSEQRQFEVAQAERERVLDEQKENKKLTLGFVAEAAKMGNAPMLIMQRAQQAKTAMEALQILAPYLSDPIEKAQALLDLDLSKERIKSEVSGRNLADEKFRFEKGITLEELGLKRKEAELKEKGGGFVDAKEYQFKANLFANRLADANTSIAGLQGYVVKANPAVFSAQTSAENTTIGNALVPAEIQQVRQAQRNFINAVLRRESGAVISPSEFAEGNRQYFPRPGDSPAVLQQKAQNRNAVIQALSSEAGPAMQRYEMTAQPQQPRSIEYQGKKYSVDAQGNMTPL